MNHKADTSGVSHYPAANDATASRLITPAYLLALCSGLLGTLGIFVLLLTGLNLTDNLPPPAFSNSLCVDEKLNFLRNNPIADPNLLVIGSSVAWRHVDGAALIRHSPQLRPFNGGFCGLHANQSVYVADWLLDREPSIRQVVMIADPLDFAGCWKVPDAVFDRTDADRYVYENAAPWGYYMRYFAPRSLLRNAQTVKLQRANRIEWDPLVFNRFGDGPLEPAKDRGLFYGAPEPLDRSCFTALGTLAQRLQREGRQLLVVSTPLHPQWKAEHDPDGSFLADFDRRMHATLAPSGAQYWIPDHNWTAPPNAFVDAIHLRWSAVHSFSAALAQQLRIAEARALADSVLAGDAALLQ